MGKGSKFKKLRKAAKDLPAINVKQVIPETVTGSNLIKQGLITLKDGTPVEAGLMYRQGKVFERPLNHNKIMKREYNKGGFKAAGAYAIAVIEHSKKEEALHIGKTESKELTADAK